MDSSRDGQFHISAAPRINVDPAGNLYVCDNGNSRIQKFSGTGAFLGTWGSFGSGDSQFKTPHGIAVDTAGSVPAAPTWSTMVTGGSRNA